MGESFEKYHLWLVKEIERLDKWCDELAKQANEQGKAISVLKVKTAICLAVIISLGVWAIKGIFE